ncbi:MAG TPA: ion channel [Actinomycetota bacterium]|nr:ion channel [Actinomycetota bacterium]
MAEDRKDLEEARAARRTMSFREQVRAADSYGLLLATIGLVAISIGLIGSFAPGLVANVILLSVTLLFAFHTSRVSVRAQRVAIVVVVIAVVVVALAVVAGSEKVAEVVAGGVDAILAFAALVAILRRLARHHVVITGSTVAGAACAYLLIGLFFASVYMFLGGVSAEPFFVQTAVDRPIDQLYFSFVTLTTVGYGDLTAASDVGRMLAAGEALTGQLFLVTVVALVVGNIGRARR